MFYRAVDGTTACASTKQTLRAWWTVDLGREFFISSVTITGHNCYDLFCLLFSFQVQLQLVKGGRWWMALQKLLQKKKSALVKSSSTTDSKTNSFHLYLLCTDSEDSSWCYDYGGQWISWSSYKHHSHEDMEQVCLWCRSVSFFLVKAFSLTEFVCSFPTKFYLLSSWSVGKFIPRTKALFW